MVLYIHVSGCCRRSVGYSVSCFRVYNEGVKKFILLCICVSFSFWTGCEMTFAELNFCAKWRWSTSCISNLHFSPKLWVVASVICIVSENGRYHKILCT